MNTMRDLHTLRPSDDAIDREFSPARREEIFQQVLEARSGIVPLRARRRRWPAAVAATAAGAAVVVLAVQVMVPQRGPLIAEPLPATSAPLTNAPTTATVPPERKTPHPPVVLPIERLTSMAEAAATGAPIADGTFLHVETLEEQGPETDYWSSYSSYTDSDGWTWTLRSGHIRSWTLTRSAEVFAALPTDPAALDAAARALGGSNSGDERVYREMVDILRADVAPAELRAAAMLVLQGIAREPQLAEITKDGDIATPVVTVTDDRTDGSDKPRLRVTFTDPTSRPGGADWIVLGPAGTFAERGSSNEDLTFRGVSLQREIVTELPDDFVDALGTETVEKFIEE